MLHGAAQYPDCELKLMRFCADSSRIVVVAPHPDDEAIGAAVLIRRMQTAGIPVTLLLLTTGVATETVLTDTFIERFGRHKKYLAIRQSEFNSAVQYYGPLDLRTLPLASREVHLNMGNIGDVLRSILSETPHPIVIAPSFEGGHPDHDTANCVCASVCRATKTPCFEYLGYHMEGGALQIQRFRPFLGQTTIFLKCSDEEIDFKSCVLAAYASQQGTVLSDVNAGVEGFQSLPKHRYYPTPWAEPTYYERWGAGISTQTVAEACARYLQRK